MYSSKFERGLYTEHYTFLGGVKGGSLFCRRLSLQCSYCEIPAVIISAWQSVTHCLWHWISNHHRATTRLELSCTIYIIWILHLMLSLLLKVDKVNVIFAAAWSVSQTITLCWQQNEFHFPTTWTVFSGCIFTDMDQVISAFFLLYESSRQSQKAVTWANYCKWWKQHPKCHECKYFTLIHKNPAHLMYKILFIPNPLPKNLHVAYTCTNMVSIPLP
jgi:hypothetical protein